MAVNTRLSAPSYKIFEPDSLDVMLSQHVLDPLQGGLAGAMLLNHGVDSQNAQQQFLESNDKFNNMARGLDAMEIAQKSQEARMKLAPGLLEHGTDAKDILGIGDLLGQDGILSNKTASMFQSKNAAEIAALNAKANADHNSGKETTTVTSYEPGSMSNVAHKYIGAPKPEDVPAKIDLTASTPNANTPQALNKQATINMQQRVMNGMATIGATSPNEVVGSIDPKTGNLNMMHKSDPNRKAVVLPNGTVQRGQ